MSALILSLWVSAVPCAPFTPPAGLEPPPRKIVRVGLTADGTVLVVEQLASGLQRALRADSFARELQPMRSHPSIVRSLPPEEFADWPVARSGLTLNTVLRSPTRGLFVIAGDRVFEGHGPELVERRVVGSSFSLGGLHALTFEHAGQLLTLRMESMYMRQLPPTLNLGRVPLETLEQVTMPKAVRFSCLEIVWW